MLTIMPSSHSMYSAILQFKAQMKLTYNYVLIHICWHKPILETVLLLLVTKNCYPNVIPSYTHCYGYLQIFILIHCSFPSPSGHSEQQFQILLPCRTFLSISLFSPFRMSLLCYCTYNFKENTGIYHLQS